MAKYLYFLPSLLLFAGLIYLLLFAGQEVMIQKSRFLGWFILVYFLFTIPKLTFSILSLFDLPLKYFFKFSFSPFTYVGIAAVIIWIGVFIYGSAWGKTQFDVKPLSYHSSLLPKGFNGYKIVQLSDIHIGSWKGNQKALREAVELANAQHPDLIVFTGDLVNHQAVELDGFKEILSMLRAKDGVYSILGNHDYGPYYPWKSPRDQADNLTTLKQEEAKMGWILLNNEHRVLHHNGDSIALVGVENWGEPPFSQHGDLKKALDGTENIPFKLLLSHNPSHWKSEVLPKSDVSLMLSGHTHGMQLALGHHSFASIVYPQWSGFYTQGNQSLYVNVGLGFIGIPFRFGAWPEITVITLNNN